VVVFICLSHKKRPNSSIIKYRIRFDKDSIAAHTDPQNYEWRVSWSADILKPKTLWLLYFHIQMKIYEVSTMSQRVERA